DWVDGEPVTDRRHYPGPGGGRAVAGRVVRRSDESDLALIELDRPADGGTVLRPAGEVRPGGGVGSGGWRPGGGRVWVSADGVVRQTGRLGGGYPWQGRVLAKGARVVLAQIPITEGDSGGPLVNRRGEVVGVVSAVGRPVSVAIAADEVRALLGERG